MGGSKPIKVDVRVIAATNRDLERDVAEDVSAATCSSGSACWRSSFLRCKRPEDIIELANHFLERFKSETGRRFAGSRSGPCSNWSTTVGPAMRG